MFMICSRMSETRRQPVYRHHRRRHRVIPDKAARIHISGLGPLESVPTHQPLAALLSHFFPICASSAPGTRVIFESFEAAEVIAMRSMRLSSVLHADLSYDGAHFCFRNARRYSLLPFAEGKKCRARLQF